MSVLALGIVAGFVIFVIVLAVETLHDCFTVDDAGEQAVDEIARRTGASPRHVRGSGPRTCPRGPRDRSAA